MKNTHAQAWGFDSIIGSILFVLLSVGIYLSLTQNDQTQTGYQDLQEESQKLAETLLTEGSPPAWNVTNVATVGLLSQNKINITKVEQLYVLSTQSIPQTKNLLKIKNNFFINISEPIISNNEDISKIGLEPVGATNVARETRVVVLNNKITSIEVITWN